MRVRGITCPDMSRVVNETLQHPEWEFLGINGSTHGRLLHKPSGEILTFGTTPSLASWKSLASDVERISGRVIWRRGNRRASRKRITPSGFDPSRARAETDHFHSLTDVDALLEERAEVTDALRKLAANPTRRNRPEAARLAARRVEIDQHLTNLHQPIPDDDFGGVA